MRLEARGRHRHVRTHSLGSFDLDQKEISERYTWDGIMLRENGGVIVSWTIPNVLLNGDYGFDLKLDQDDLVRFVRLAYLAQDRGTFLRLLRSVLKASDIAQLFAMSHKDIAFSRVLERLSKGLSATEEVEEEEEDDEDEVA